LIAAWHSGTSTKLATVEKEGVFKTTVPGLGDVETYGRPIRFRHATVLKDNSIIGDKRDRFEKRNALLNSVAEAGEFEYALAAAPKVNGKLVAQCSFCGAHHIWCVFYRDTKGNYLGWSGTDCFAEIVKNLGMPAHEAMVQNLKSERTRAENFRRTIEKVNDFKRDFPGLYEHRDTLAGSANPYRRLWNEAMGHLAEAKGIDEAYLAACEAGKFDRAWKSYSHEHRGYQVREDREARRIPAFLKHISLQAQDGMPIGEIINLLQEKHRAEEAAKAEALKPKSAPVAQQPAPAPAPKPVHLVGDAKAITDYAAISHAKILVDAGGYDWSSVIAKAASGAALYPGEINFIEKTYRAYQAKSSV